MHVFALRPRKPLLGIAIAAIAGIFVADIWQLSAWWIAGAALALTALTYLVPSRVLALPLAATAFAALHTLRQPAPPPTTTERPSTVEGVVLSEPDASTDGRGQPQARFTMRVERVDGAESDRLCLVRWRGAAPVYGDRVRVLGAVRAMDGPRNPGGFDTAMWLRRQGVHFQLIAESPADCAITGGGAGAWWHDFAMRSREWVKSRLDAGLPPQSEISALIHSMVLGMKGDTPPEMKELFQKTGTLHLFAVSGLNVAMLAAIAWLVLKPLRVGRKASGLLILPLLAAYAIVTGLSPSCVRASVMAAFLLIAPCFERDAVPLNSIAAAALGILAWDTHQLFSPGFQLSFVLVLAILALSGPIQRWMEKFGRPDDFIPEKMWTRLQKIRVGGWKMFCSTTGVTVSAWLGSLLFTAGYFHLFSPAAIVANLVAVLLAFCVLALGLFSLLVSALPAVAVLVNHANWLCAKALIAVVAFFAQVPGGHFYIELPHPAPQPACEIIVLDLGDGAAAHVRSGDGDWLLDCGHAGGYGSTLLPYLRSRGVNRLDGLLLSNADAGHIGAALTVLDDFHPPWLAEFPGGSQSPTQRALHAGLAERGFGRRFLARGDVLRLGDATLRVLYPPPEIERTRADDKALACMVEAGGARVLFVSDAGFFTEEWLLKNEPDLRADVLVKGWHSNDLSGTPDFIAKVAPSLIVCAAPEFGAPTADFDKWADALRTKGMTIFPQHDCGAVRVRIMVGGEVRAEPWRPLKAALETGTPAPRN